MTHKHTRLAKLQSSPYPPHQAFKVVPLHNPKKHDFDKGTKPTKTRV
jgi:hypothetical protein